MDNYNMKANFFPAKETKNGYVGFADLTISNAIKVRGIAVFEDQDKSGYHIQFPGFDGENKDHVSYVVPRSPEAYAQILDVIENAVKDEVYHFGHCTGKMNPTLTVSGHKVDEPYADGRYSMEVGDLCVVYGFSTRNVNYREGSFVAVDPPTLAPYEKDGSTIYPPAVEGLVSHYQKDGEQKIKDYGRLMRKLIMNERENLLKEHPGLNDQVKSAQMASDTDKKAMPGRGMYAMETACR